MYELFWYTLEFLCEAHAAHVLLSKSIFRDEETQVVVFCLFICVFASMIFYVCVCEKCRIRENVLWLLCACSLRSLGAESGAML